MNNKAALGIAVAVIGLVGLLISIDPQEEASTVAQDELQATNSHEEMEAEDSSRRYAEGSGPYDEAPVYAEGEDEEIYYNELGVDPRDSPRDFWTKDFRPGELPEGYELHNVSLTSEGFTLDVEDVDGPDVGMVESPPMELNFPFNALAPAWMDDLPEGTSVLIEIQISPDGENWTGWHTAEIDHGSDGQVSEFMPDGTPNPSYGYTSGGLLAFGNMLWTHWRYNIAMYSETGAAPSLSSFRLFYVDSTMGRGRLAEPNEVFFDEADLDLVGPEEGP